MSQRRLAASIGLLSLAAAGCGPGNPPPTERGQAIASNDPAQPPALPAHEPVQLSLGTQTGGSGGPRPCFPGVWKSSTETPPEAGHYEGTVLLEDWRIRCRVECFDAGCSNCYEGCREATPPADAFHHAVLEVTATDPGEYADDPDCAGSDRRAPVTWTLLVDGVLSAGGEGNLQASGYYNPGVEDPGGGAIISTTVETRAEAGYPLPTNDDLERLRGPAALVRGDGDDPAAILVSIHFGAAGTALIELDSHVVDCDVGWISQDLLRGVLRSERSEVPVVDETPMGWRPGETCEPAPSAAPELGLYGRPEDDPACGPSNPSTVPGQP